MPALSQVGQLNPHLLGSAAAEMKEGFKSHGANTSSCDTPRSLSVSWGLCPPLWWLGSICVFLPVLTAGAVLRLAHTTSRAWSSRDPDSVVNMVQVCGEVPTSTQQTCGSV